MRGVQRRRKKSGIVKSRADSRDQDFGAETTQALSNMVLIIKCCLSSFFLIGFRFYVSVAKSFVKTETHC